MSVDYFLAYWTDLSPEKRKDQRNLILYTILVCSFLVSCLARSSLFMIGASRVSPTMAKPG